MKFKDYPYVRPNMEETKQKFDEFMTKFKNATSVEQQYEAIDEINKVRSNFDTMASLCNVRNTINTQDEFYEKEKEFFDENSPVYSGYEHELVKTLLDSKFINDLRVKYGNRLFDAAELSLKTFKNEIIEDLQVENKLTTQYVKLVASAKIEFMGKVNNLSQMTPYLMNIDRNIRKDAEAAVCNFLQENEDKFDEIYDKLVKVRTTIANKLGFSNFVELAYARLGRTDYNSLDVANYRKQVKEDLVPLVEEIIAEKGKRLGIKDLKSYDLSLNFLTGNPTPKGNKEYLVNAASKMYHEMSKETGEFFDFMMEKELLDLEAKPGKAGGGYCTYLPDFKSPFIFSNFNGTSGDVDVLTHEAGHAFQVFSSRHFSVPEYLWPTMESAEIHSMSMEFFAWPWMKDFFKEDTDKYLYSHLASTITFIPYGVTVDEFQHGVYENPNMTPEERKKMWREIEKKYMPYKVYENEFLDKGTYWFRQSHIYEVPFYYIDYTLAQVCAQQYWILNNESHEKAWESYMKLCKLGGSKSFLELLKEANLQSPFIDGTVKFVTSKLKKWLDEFDHSKLA